jgi:SNF2 family DNA or RNA helicase
VGVPYADKLYNYQTIGAAWLATVKRGILADEPGLGKTIQSLAACDLLDAARVLIFTVNETVQNQWVETIRDWGLGTVVNVKGTKAQREALLARTARFYVLPTSCLSSADAPRTGSKSSPLRRFLATDWDVVIVDEAHMLQSKESKRTKAVLKIKSPALFMLTGTPVWNLGPSLWSLLHVIDKNRWSSEWLWLERYFNIITTPFGRKIGHVRREMLEALRVEIGGVMLRRSLVDIHADLPEAKMINVELIAPPDLRAEYKLLKKTIFDYLPVSMRGETRQIATRTQAIPILREFLNDPTARGARFGNPKLDKILEICTEFTGSILVFTWHTAYAEKLAAVLPNAQAFHGKLSHTERSLRLERFRRGQTRILVASMASIGVGVDLPQVGAAVFAETDWTPAIVEQSWRRIYRITSTSTKLVYFVYYAKTVESLVYNAFQRKAVASEELIANAVFNELD